MDYDSFKAAYIKECQEIEKKLVECGTGTNPAGVGSVAQPGAPTKKTEDSKDVEASKAGAKTKILGEGEKAEEEKKGPSEGEAVALAEAKKQTFKQPTKVAIPAGAKKMPPKETPYKAKEVKKGEKKVEVKGPENTSDNDGPVEKEGKKGAQKAPKALSESAMLRRALWKQVKDSV